MDLAQVHGLAVLLFDIVDAQMPHRRVLLDNFVASVGRNDLVVETYHKLTVWICVRLLRGSIEFDPGEIVVGILETFVEIALDVGCFPQADPQTRQPLHMVCIESISLLFGLKFSLQLSHLRSQNSASLRVGRGQFADAGGA